MKRCVTQNEANVIGVLAQQILDERIDRPACFNGRGKELHDGHWRILRTENRGNHAHPSPVLLGGFLVL